MGLTDLQANTGAHGRSQSGLASLKENLQADCTAMKDTLTGEKYTALVNAIRACWSGEDADRWLSSLDTKIEQIKTAITNLNTQVENQLDTDYADFVRYQQSRGTQQ